jgi:hypothetical protein
MITRTTVTIICIIRIVIIHQRYRYRGIVGIRLISGSTTTTTTTVRRERSIGGGGRRDDKRSMHLLSMFVCIYTKERRRRMGTQINLRRMRILFGQRKFVKDYTVCIFIHIFISFGEIENNERRVRLLPSFKK